MRRADSSWYVAPALLTGVLGLALATAPAAAAEGSCRVKVVRNLAYYEGAGADPVRNRLDLYLPEGKKDFPVLVMVHGGAWVMGDKSFFGWGNDLGHYFASRGFGVVMPSYRLSPAVKYPEHVKDVARAFAWTERHIAAYGGNPREMFLCGHSAGGHLVSLLATDPRFLQAEGLKLSAIRGVISVSGVYRIPALDLSFTINVPTAESLVALIAGPGKAMAALPQGAPKPAPEKSTVPLDFGLRLLPFRSVFGNDPQACKDASPLNHVRPGLPPFLLICADHDLPTLPQQAREFAAALKTDHDRVRLLEVKDRNHENVMFDATNRDDPVAQAIERFVRAHWTSAKR